MTLSVDVLLGCAIDDVESSAQALRADARIVDDICRRLAGPDSTWSGQAADAASSRLDQVQAALRGLSEGVLACAQLLLAATNGLRPARDAIERAGVVAAQLGMALRADGRVAFAPVGGAAAGTVPGEAWLAGFAVAQGGTAAAAQALAQAALAAATQVDDDAARAFARAGQPFCPAPPARPSAASWLPPHIPSKGSALDVAAWWSVLPAGARVALLATSPGSLGTLDGLPAQVRHEANVSVLSRELARVEEELAPARRPGTVPIDAVVKAVRRRAMLLSVRRELAADPSRRLMTLDFADGGLAAVSIGDIDTATHVAVVVPGLEQDVTSDLDAVVGNADHLRLATRTLTRDGELLPSVATVGWLGYRTPTFATVHSDRQARVGARRLASFAAGVVAARAIERMSMPTITSLHLTLIGHSYGSLTLGYAMRSRPPADDVVILGSPGVGASSARELAPDGHVFVGEAKGDPVADLAWFGRDPSDPAFGAKSLQTDGGTDPLTGERLRASHGHSEYFDSGTESVRNVAAVVIGRPTLATTGDMRGKGDLWTTLPFPRIPRL